MLALCFLISILDNQNVAGVLWSLCIFLKSLANVPVECFHTTDQVYLKLWQEYQLTSEYVKSCHGTWRGQVFSVSANSKKIQSPSLYALTCMHGFAPTVQKRTLG